MRARGSAVVGAALWLLGCIAFAGEAAAQGTARSMDIDTSVRSSGRGGASVAVHWDGGNEWANPALLGYRNGLSVTWDRHELVPGLADDVVLSSRRVSLGLWGVGFSTAGQPVDVFGGVDLDYGVSEAADVNGNVISTWRSYEHVRAWSLGVSAATVLEHVAGFFGRHPNVADWADVSVGASRKRAAVSIVPPLASWTDADDLGMFVRVSPLDTRRSAGEGAGATHRLDLGFGHSVLNANDAAIDFGYYGSSPTSRLGRTGGAIGWTMRTSPGAFDADRRLRRITGPDRALVRVAMAFDREHVSAGDDESRAFDVDRWGMEAALGRVAALRVGHVSDVTGDLVGFTWGFGLGAPLGPLAEAAYDFASTPQARDSGLRNRHSHAVTLRLDVLETLRNWREEDDRADAN